jgi:hypothetical protein
MEEGIRTDPLWIGPYLFFAEVPEPPAGITGYKTCPFSYTWIRNQDLTGSRRS